MTMLGGMLVGLCMCHNFAIFSAHGIFKFMDKKYPLSFFREDALRTEAYCHLCAMLQAKSENDYLKYQDAFEFKFQSINPGFLRYPADRHVSPQEK